MNKNTSNFLIRCNNCRSLDIKITPSLENSYQDKTKFKLIVSLYCRNCAMIEYDICGGDDKRGES